MATTDTKIEKPLATGTVIEHYRILRHLGRGHNGDSYLVFDRASGTHAALKWFFPDRFPSRPVSEQFMQGTQKIRVEHPHVARFREVLIASDRPAVIFDFVSGQTLRERMRAGLLGMLDIHRFGMQIASALADAHAREVSHLNLSPENIIASDDGRFRITDFGLGRLLQRSGDKLPDGTVPVTGGHEYLAPEQFRGEFSGPPADIWALGNILYELCSGVPAYTPKITQTIGLQVASADRAPRLPQNSRAVSPELTELIQRCQQKAPAQRPPAGELVKYFARIVAEANVPQSEPFRGLLPFVEADAGVYFGRDDDVAACVELLQRTPRVVVTAGAGAGKTSFVNAGVVARLRPEWLVLSMRPGPDPLAALAAAVMESETEEARVAWHEKLAATPELLAMRLEALAAKENKRVVLLVDALEEVLALPAPTRLAFLAALRRAATDAGDPVRVLCTAREDSLSKTGGSALGETFTLAPPDKFALANVVQRTLAVVGATTDEPQLADMFVTDASFEAAPLALMQFAMTLVWSQRDPAGRVLRRSDYDNIKGMRALGDYGHQVVATMPDKDRLQARDLLFRLVSAEGTRLALTRAAILDSLPATAEAALDHLVQTHLIVERHERYGEPLLELACDLLISEWPELAGWLAERRGDALFAASVDEAAAHWQTTGQAAGDTWRGDRLHAAEHRLAHSLVPASRAAKEFLAAGRTREEAGIRRRRILLGSVWVALIVITLVAARFAAVSFLGKRNAEAAKLRTELERTDAQLDAAGGAVRSGNYLQARADVRAAEETKDSPLGRALWSQLANEPALWRRDFGADVPQAALSDRTVVAAVGNAVAQIDADTTVTKLLRGGHEQPVSGVAVIGAVIASGDRGGKVGTWKNGTFTALGSSSSAVTALAGAGDTLAAATKNDGIQLWSLAAGGAARPVHGAGAPLAISSDGKHLAAGSRGGVAMIDVATGAVGTTLPGGANAVALSADGSVLAWGGDDGEIRVAAGGGAPHVLKWFHESVTALALSGDGKWLAAGSDSGVILLGGSEGKAPPSRLGAHHGTVNSLSFDGARVLSAGRDGAVRLWRVVGGGATDRLPPVPPHAPIVALEMGRDKSFFVSTGAEGALNLWDVNTAAVKKTLTGHAKNVTAMDISADGRMLATASADGTTRLWDLPSGEEGKTLTIAAGPVKAVRIVDRKTVITGHADGKIRIWNAFTAKNPRSTVNAYGDMALAISADGKRALTAGGHGAAQLWKVQSGQGGKSLPSGGARFTAAAFTNDAVVTGDSKGRVILWVEKGPPKTLFTHEGGVNDVYVDRLSKHVASAGADRVVNVFDLDTNAVVALRGLPEAATAVAISEDGKLVVAADEDGDVRIWQTNGRAYWRAPLLTHSGPDLLTQAGWQNVATGEAEKNDKAWKKAALERADLAAESADGSLVCFSTGEKLELWSPANDKQLAAVDATRPDDIAATAQGCITLKSGTLSLYAPSGTPTNLGATASAFGISDKRIVAVDGPNVSAWTAAGDKQPQLPGALGAIAIAESAGVVVVGFEDGSLARVSKDGLSLFAPGPRTRIVKLVAGPEGTVAAGDAAGYVGLWDAGSGRLLKHGELHARVTALTVAGTSLYAASEVGNWLRFELGALGADYCALVKEMWGETPVHWLAGAAVAVAPPDGHACLTAAAKK